MTGQSIIKEVRKSIRKGTIKNYEIISEHRNQLKKGRSQDPLPVRKIENNEGLTEPQKQQEITEYNLGRQTIKKKITTKLKKEKWHG